MPCCYATLLYFEATLPYVEGTLHYSTLKLYYATFRYVTLRLPKDYLAGGGITELWARAASDEKLKAEDQEFYAIRIWSATRSAMRTYTWKTLRTRSANKSTYIYCPVLYLCRLDPDGYGCALVH